MKDIHFNDYASRSRGVAPTAIGDIQHSGVRRYYILTSAYLYAVRRVAVLKLELGGGADSPPAYSPCTFTSSKVRTWGRAQIIHQTLLTAAPENGNEQDLVNRGLMFPTVYQSTYDVGSNTSSLVVLGVSANGSPFQVSIAFDDSALLPSEIHVNLHLHTE